MLKLTSNEVAFAMDFNFIPLLSWEGEPTQNPTCNGCRSNSGWSFESDTGYWVCGTCRKPSPANLRECEYCELIYLPAHFDLLKNTVPGRRELTHEECANDYD